MASIVQALQTVGPAAKGTIAFAKPTAGNLLVLMVAQSGSVAEPTLAGWTTIATHSLNNTSANSTWAMSRVATGVESEYTVTPGAGGTIQALDFFEASGLANEVDVIVHTDNAASAKTVTTPSMTTTDAGGGVFAAVSAGSTSFGVVSAWTGTGPMTLVPETGSRILGGSYIPGTTLSGATFTANWESAKAMGILAVAFKSANTRNGSPATVTGGGAAAVAGVKVGRGAAAITGGGASSAGTGRKTALGVPRATGGGSATASGIQVSPPAIVSGGGSAHAAGQKVSTGRAAITGGGNASATPGPPTRTGTPRVSGGGNATASGAAFTLPGQTGVRPSVGDVAALLRARTKIVGGTEAGTFNAQTRPTALEVEELITEGENEVLGKIVKPASFAGVDPTAYEARIRGAIRLYAAVLIETSYFPEQVGTGKSAAASYERLYDMRIKALIAEGETGEPEGMGDKDAPADAAWTFPGQSGLLGWGSRW